jgi:hypothetical protein
MNKVLLLDEVGGARRVRIHSYDGATAEVYSADDIGSFLSRDTRLRPEILKCLRHVWAADNSK